MIGRSEEDHIPQALRGPRKFWNGWRVVGWGLAALLLALPAVAMQFTEEVLWGETDFIVMGILLGGTGLAVEWLIRRSPSLCYRLGSLVSLLTVFLTIWANLAVGMIGSEDNPFNLLFLGVLLIAASGAALARFSPRGMALSSGLAAAAQAAVAAAGAAIDPRGAIFSGLFARLWLLSAILFWSGERRGRS